MKSSFPFPFDTPIAQFSRHICRYNPVALLRFSIAYHYDDNIFPFADIVKIFSKKPGVLKASALTHTVRIFYSFNQRIFEVEQQFLMLPLYMLIAFIGQDNFGF